MVISGTQNFKSVDIDKSLLGEDKKDVLENSVLRSVNVAVKRSQELAAQKMRESTGLNLPGF